MNLAIGRDETKSYVGYAQLLKTLCLAYYPTSPNKDDTFRKIQIRPKQSGLVVRAKTGYFSR